MKINDAFLKATFNRYLIPTMLCVLGGTVNVFFDGILIGNILGEEALVIVNLCFPIHLLLCTLGSLIASGASVLSAQEIGRNDLDKSRRIFGTAILLTLVFSFVFSITGVILIDFITRILSSGTPLDGLRIYALIIICGGIPKVLLYIPLFYLRFDGKSKQASFVMLTMTALNIVLDLIFMLPFNMGIAGAAYADVIATLFACIMGYFFILKKGTTFAYPITTAHSTAALNILKTGSPSALNNLATAARILIINIILLSVAGNNIYPVIFAVITAISEFSLFIINGIPQTAMPIISVYSVEKSNAGIRLLMKRQIITGLTVISIFGLLLVVFHASISKMFGISQNIFVPLVCLFISLIIGQLNSIMTYYFNSVERIFLANIITISRILIMPAFFALLLVTGNLGPVWLFLPLSEFITLLLWLGVVSIQHSGKQELSPILLLDDILEKNGKAIDFSVKSNPDEICYASQRITEFCEDNNMTARQTMRISLAIEEIMTAMAEKSMGGREGSFDVRVFSTDEDIGLRIRNAGEIFNPISPCDTAGNVKEDENLMGIKMIADMVKEFKYITTFGVNSFFIRI